MKLELDEGKVIYEFGESEFEGHKFLSLKKVTMPFKQGEKAKFQNLTIRLKDWPEVRNFLKQIAEVS
jgi:hypothetical protein